MQKKHWFHFTFLLCLVVNASNAQTLSTEKLTSLINAELDFSRMAGEKNTRDAFLHFLSDSAITFGERPRMGKDYLLRKEADSSLLVWYPVFAEISASEDFGYTYGPWEYKNKRTDEKPLAAGHFISVWNKINGVWKVALDIGINHPFTAQSRNIDLTKFPASHGTAKVSLKDILAIEKTFIHQFQTNANDAYKKHINHHTKFFRSNLLPFNFDKIKQDNVSYELINGDVASSGDLAFVYGTAKWSHEETPAENQGANYVRIWKKEGAHWKIVADVLSEQ